MNEYEIRQAQVEKYLQSATTVVFDLESDGLRWDLGKRLIGIAIGFPEYDYWTYLPYRHGEGYNLPLDGMERIKQLWGREGVTYIGFNTKFDLLFLAADGFPDVKLVEDVQLVAQLVNCHEEISHGQKKGAYALKRLARTYLGAEAGAGEDELMEELALKFPDAKKSDLKGLMWTLPVEKVDKYATMDVIITWQLREFYRPNAVKWGVWDLYFKRNEFLLHFLYRAERIGILIDRDELQRQTDEVTPTIERIAAQFVELSVKMGLKQPFNIDSPYQLKPFFAMLGLKLENTQEATIRKALHAKKTPDHARPWLALILDYKHAHTLNKMFYTPYPGFIGDDGAIHSNSLPIASYTGRINASNPNLLQTPKGEFRKMFIARPGYKFVYADYAALEFRLAIEEAGQQDLIDVVNAGQDQHQYTADNLSEILGVPVSRQMGKNCNFGLLYGMGAERAAAMLETDVETAEKIVMAFRKAYPQLRRYSLELQALARQWRHPDETPGGNFQFIRLPNGRVITFHMHEKYGYKTQYHDALNGRIQGRGTSMTEMAATRLAQMWPDDDIVRPILMVHDSLTFEVREDYINEFARDMKFIMEDWDTNPRMEAIPEVSQTLYNGDMTPLFNEKTGEWINYESLSSD